MDLEVENSIKNIIKRIDGMNQYKDSGSAEVREIENLRIAVEDIRKSREDPNGKLRKMLKDYSKSQGRTKKNKHNKQELKRLMVEMEEAKIDIANLDASIDYFEEKFRKYNVPKRKLPSERLQHEYLPRLLNFIKTTWRKRAESCRKNERKSLTEWMQRLDLSNEEDNMTFNELKTVLCDIGFRITKFLNEYFLLIMATLGSREEMKAKIVEVETMIRCLCVEENSSSVVIKTFVSATRYFDREMRTAGPFSADASGGTKDIIFVFDEHEANDIIHLILIEVLRLEVSFCYPDLPMMVTNDVFVSMANHLTENVFEDKLNRISAKIDGLKSDFQFIQDDSKGSNSSSVKFLEQLLDNVVKEIWKEMDLNKERESKTLADEDVEGLDNDLSKLNFCVHILEQRIFELKTEKDKATEIEPKISSSKDIELLPELEKELAFLKKKIEQYKQEAKLLKNIILNEPEETVSPNKKSLSTLAETNEVEVCSVASELKSYIQTVDQNMKAARKILDDNEFQDRSSAVSQIKELQKDQELFKIKFTDFLGMSFRLSLTSLLSSLDILELLPQIKPEKEQLNSLKMKIERCKKAEDSLKERLDIFASKLRSTGGYDKLSEDRSKDTTDGKVDNHNKQSKFSKDQSGDPKSGNGDDLHNQDQSKDTTSSKAEDHHNQGHDRDSDKSRHTSSSNQGHDELKAKNTSSSTNSSETKHEESRQSTELSDEEISQDQSNNMTSGKDD